jgi:lycopene beta-cyclase
MSSPSPLHFDYLLVGGGLAGSLLALALFRHRPQARVALVEKQAKLGGNHLWCFHAGDVEQANELVQPLVAQRWPRYEVRFPDLRRTLEEPYAAVPSERLDQVVQRAFAEREHARLYLGETARRVTASSVELASGPILTADVVIESRGPEAFAAAPGTGFQKFIGLELEVESSSPLGAPRLMDALVPQKDGFRFMYALPLTGQRVLLEDTYFSDSPELRPPELEAEIMAYAERLGLKVVAVRRRESGVLPLPLSAPRLRDPEPDAPFVAGYQGGWFHPVTGYSFPLAVRLARAVAGAEPSELRARVWPALLRRQRSQLRFAVLLNRMLFTAFESGERYRAIERFYRLPVESIRRFYALDLTASDRLRLVCGRPPRGFSFPRVLAAGLSRGGAAV